VSRLDSAQLAMPYALEPSRPQRRYYSKKDANMHAAGGPVTTAADMARWLEVQLNQGKLDGRQVLPQRVVAMTQTEATTATQQRGDMQMIGYGLGWMLATLNGDTVLTHGGGFATFQAQIAFSPKQRVGVAVLTTEHRIGGGMAEMIAQYVLEYAQNAEAAREKYVARMARRLWVQMGVLQSEAEVFDAAKDQLRAEPTATGEVFTFKFVHGRTVSVSYNGREYIRK
jgi:CubicO group peptidase (beta-lactamase class C family)